MPSKRLQEAHCAKPLPRICAPARGCRVISQAVGRLAVSSSALSVCRSRLPFAPPPCFAPPVSHTRSAQACLAAELLGPLFQPCFCFCRRRACSPAAWCGKGAPHAGCMPALSGPPTPGHLVSLGAESGEEERRGWSNPFQGSGGVIEVEAHERPWHQHPHENAACLHTYALTARCQRMPRFVHHQRSHNCYSDTSVPPQRLSGAVMLSHYCHTRTAYAHAASDQRISAFRGQPAGCSR